MKFGSDLDDDTLRLIKKGELLTFLLTQNRFSPVSSEEQIVTLFGGMNGYFTNIDLRNINKVKKKMMKFLRNSFIFSPHLELIRFKQYYKLFKNTSLELIFGYYINFKNKNEIY